jgi:hypothetical protein
MAAADDARAEELAELARQLLRWLRDHDLPGLPGTKGLAPADFSMMAGVYRELAPEAKLLGGPLIQFWDDPEEQRRLRAVKLGARHVLLIADPAVQVWVGGAFFVQNELYLTGDGDLEKEGALAVTDPRLDSAVADAATLATYKYLTFAGLTNRADLVWDDADEAARVRFKTEYRWIFEYETPRPAFEANVRDIIPLDDSVGLTEFREYLYWFATYRNREYAREEGGDYYKKWKAKTPLRRSEREYRPTKLSTDYLRECFYEYVLKRKERYLLIEAIGQQLLYRLVLTPGKGRGKPPKLSVQLILRFQDLTHQDPGDEPIINKPVPAVIFHALDGSKDLPPQLGPRGHADLGGVASGRYAYDYKAAVRWYFRDDHMDPGDDQAWFNLFVDVLFPDAVYPVNGTLSGAKSSSLSIEELAAVAADATGPLKDQLDEMVAVAERSPGVRFVVKGSYYGDTEASRRQLIGVSKDAVYEWFPRTGLVTRMDLAAWYRQNELGKIFAEVYESTKGALPFILLVTWGGVAAIGGAVFGGAALANLARGLIRDLAQDALAKRLTRELIRKFRAQLIALVADGLLELLPRTDNLLFELLRGFVHGFGAGAVEHYLSQLDDRFEKQVKKLYRTALNKATGGVNRVYQLYLKISAAYHKLSGLFHALRAVWSEELAVAAAAGLVVLGRSIGIALVVAVFVFVYVDHVYGSGKLDQAKRDAWVKHQRDVLRFMIKETGADLAAYAEALREDLTGDPPSADVVRERNDRLARSIADAVIKAPAEAPGVMEILREILGELGIDNWQELVDLGFLELLGRGFDAVLADHPDLAARGARVLGEALGELIGTIFLERAVLPARWRKGKITGSRAIDRSIRKTLAGGTAPALWKFARVPLDELREAIPALAEDVPDLPDLPTESQGLFERVQRGDTAYRDLLRDLLKDERELGASTGQLAMDETLPDRIREITARAQAESPPDIESVLAGEDVLWPRDALLFVLETWLRVALLQLLRAFDVLEDDAPFGGHFRLSTLLEIAGLEVSLDDKTAAQLAVKFERD